MGLLLAIAYLSGAALYADTSLLRAESEGWLFDAREQYGWYLGYPMLETVLVMIFSALWPVSLICDRIYD